MKNAMIIILLVWITTSPLLSCIKLKEPQFLSVEKIKLDKLNFTTSTLLADLHFFNPNGLGVTLGKSELDVYINQTSLGHISKEQNIAIARKSRFIIPVELKIDLKQLLLSGIASQLSDKTQIRVVGTVLIKKAGLTKKMAVDYSTEKDFSMIKLF